MKPSLVEFSKSCVKVTSFKVTRNPSDVTTGDVSFVSIELLLVSSFLSFSEIFYSDSRMG